MKVNDTCIRDWMLQRNMPFVYLSSWKRILHYYCCCYCILLCNAIKKKKTKRKFSRQIWRINIEIEWKEYDKRNMEENYSLPDVGHVLAPITIFYHLLRHWPLEAAKIRKIQWERERKWQPERNKQEVSTFKISQPRMSAYLKLTKFFNTIPDVLNTNVFGSKLILIRQIGRLFCHFEFRK